jgi:hypothetical protein
LITKESQVASENGAPLSLSLSLPLSLKKKENLPAPLAISTETTSTPTSKEKAKAFPLGEIAKEMPGEPYFSKRKEQLRDNSKQWRQRRFNHSGN